MEAKWLQNGSLEASGRPLGADSASRGSPEPSWRGSGAARGCLKISCWRLGGLLGRKVGRFHASGGPPEGPGEASGGHFGGIFAERPGGTKKVINLSEFSLFLAPFFGCILFQFLRLPGGAGARAHLRKTGFHVEGVAFSHVRRLRAEPTREGTLKKSNRNKSENASKKTQRRSTHDNHQNMCGNEPKCLPKSIPEASRGLFGARLVPGGSQNRFRRRPGSAQERHKTILERFSSRTGIRGVSREYPGNLILPTWAPGADKSKKIE